MVTADRQARRRAAAPGSMPGRDERMTARDASSASQSPRTSPCVSIASSAYAEHDGSKRHAPPANGLSSELIAHGRGRGRRARLAHGIMNRASRRSFPRRRRKSARRRLKTARRRASVPGDDDEVERSARVPRVRSSALRRRNISRSRRLARLRTTAPPTRREAMMPEPIASRACSAARASSSSAR